MRKNRQLPETVNRPNRGAPRQKSPSHAARLVALAGLLIALSIPAGFAQESPRAISLDGDWSFLPDPGGRMVVTGLGSAANVRPIHVPSSWQSQFVDARDYAGVAWYWRGVTLEPLPPGHVALLKFGAVDYKADVYFNSVKVGSHQGGYLPFEFDVTTFVRPGENQVAVRVADPGRSPSEVEGIRYAEIPHGKQSWYVQTSGLWQDVEIEIRPALRLGSVKVSAGADSRFRIVAAVVGGMPGAQSLSAEISDPDGDEVWRQTRALAAGAASAEFAGQVPPPRLWSPASPALYTLRLTLSSGDVSTVRFGFRTFEAREGKFYLNGKPIYLRGALDQDFYPETVYTTPSLDYARNEMRLARSLGLNLLRCHIKVPDPRYLQAADEAGVLIWYEIPSWDKLTEDSKRRAMETLRGMAERDWNHPSIVIVSLLNESWGADLKSAADRAWLRSAYEDARKIGPGWLVDDNSPCCDNFHVETDLADFHSYSAVPDYAENFERLIADQATRPGWLFSPYGDARPRGDEPLMLSEFGNWGLPRIPDPKPWWFSRPFGDRELTLPEGVEDRFKESGLGTIFKDLGALVEATQWHEYESLKYEIESLRSHSRIQGYVITEFTDVNWESNGLLDMWRHPKVFAADLARLQQDDQVVVRTEKRNYTSGENVRAEVFLSHYGSAPFDRPLMTWRLEGSSLVGAMPLPSVQPATSQSLGTLEFKAPEVAKPEKKILNVRVTSGGRVLTEDPTGIALYFYPTRPPDIPPSVAFHDPTGRLRRLVNEMRERGYQQPSGAEVFPVLVSSVFDDEVRRALAKGGRVILLPSDAQPIAPGLEIIPRTKEGLDGNWISSFAWNRKESAPFRGIAPEALAGFETESVTPNSVVKGVPAANQDDVLAGIFYGWIHSNVATLVQAQAGSGKLIICTYALATTYGSDPYATYLLDGLVNYAVSGFTPRFRIPLQ